MIDLAVFDIAGTTVEEDGVVYEALAQAVRAHGGTPSEGDVERWMGADKRTAITALLDGSGDVDSAFREFRALLGQRYRERPPRPMPGVIDVFDRLREQEIRIALTTGFDREVTDLVLGAVGWTGSAVDTTICADDVAVGRPAPFMIFHAMERLGCADVRRVLVAGDTPRDVAAGLAAGAGTVVGVRTGGVADAALAIDPRVVVLDSVADVPDVVGLASGR